MDLVAEEVDDDDLAAEMSNVKGRVEAQRRAKATVAEQAARATSAAGCSSDRAPLGDGLKRIKWVAGRGLHQREAKDYLPPGAFLSKDTARHYGS